MIKTLGADGDLREGGSGRDGPFGVGAPAPGSFFPLPLRGSLRSSRGLGGRDPLMRLALLILAMDHMNSLASKGSDSHLAP